MKQNPPFPYFYWLCMIITGLASCSPFEKSADDDTLPGAQPVIGWNILSEDWEIARRVVDSAAARGVNHLQLSHHIVMDLKDLREDDKAERVNELTQRAHTKGIEEVAIWDHSLYGLNYYPDQFKTGPENTIDLDNPEFWTWLKKDYREMLDLVPEVDAVVLTFIETGAHVEDQFSRKLKTEEEKLAAMVDTLASVIIGERGMNLYVRTFIYTRAELSSLLKCLNLIENQKVRVMTKETPHDFFLTHPVSSFIEDIQKPVLIEFDAAHEYNGQGIIASIFPEIHLKRWRHYEDLPNVVGFVARTDRKGNTSVVFNPSGLNLYVLEQAARDRSITSEQATKQFIRRNYSEEALPFVFPAYKMAPDIILGSLYTLGLNLNNHSRFDLEDASTFQRHVSGKWMGEPYAELAIGLDTTLHYWSDIVNHLAPAWYKDQATAHQLSSESQWVYDSAWLSPEDELTPFYVELVMKEKAAALRLANEAVVSLQKAEGLVTDREFYDTTMRVFERTLLTAELYHAASKAYWNYRLFDRGLEDRDIYAAKAADGLQVMSNIIHKMMDYPYTGPEGQFEWKEDIARAIHWYMSLSKALDSDAPYSPQTIPLIPYSGLTDEQEAALILKFKGI